MPIGTGGGNWHQNQSPPEIEVVMRFADRVLSFVLDSSHRLPEDCRRVDDRKRRTRRRSKSTERLAKNGVADRCIAHGEKLEHRLVLSAAAYSASMLKDINATPASSNPTDIVAVGDEAFFVATDQGHGTELWKSDGTSAGTVLVKDIVPGTAGSAPSNLTNVNGTLFFTVGDELWKSDGTAAGTIEVPFVPSGASVPMFSGGNFFSSTIRRGLTNSGSAMEPRRAPRTSCNSRRGSRRMA